MKTLARQSLLNSNIVEDHFLNVACVQGHITYILGNCTYIFISLGFYFYQDYQIVLKLYVELFFLWANTTLSNILCG